MEKSDFKKRQKDYYTKIFDGLKRFVNCYHEMYGHISFVETNNHYLVITSNGGWSENEYLELEFKEIMQPSISDHPTHIWEFQKYMINTYFNEFKEWFMKQNHYEFQEEYSCEVVFN